MNPIKTPEMHQFLREYFPEHTHQEIVLEFNKRYPGMNFTYAQSRAYAKNHKLKTCNTWHFKPGIQNGIVTQQFLESGKKTRFKSGHVPKNHMSVGSVVVATIGYHKIKVAEPNRWRLYSRYIWEKEKGPIPKGYRVIHINGDMLDDRIENLDCVSPAVAIYISKYGLKSSEEINQAVITLSKLKAKIVERG